MNCDREHWKKMLPIVTAFVEGESVDFLDMENNWVAEGENPQHGFLESPSRYRIAKPKERVPLEAEDWIKDGPWWIRYGDSDMNPCMVVSVDEDGLYFLGRRGNQQLKRVHIDGSTQRRNATSDWMPCWKEKE